MKTRFLVLLALASLTLSCSSGSSSPDPDSSPSDTTEDGKNGDVRGDVADAVVPDSLGDLGTDLPPDVVEIQGAASAFVSTTEEQLIAGPVRAGVVGDVVMHNDRVRFVIRNQQHSLYSPYGGALVDADRVRAAGEAGGETFFEMFPMAGLARIFYPTSMEIVDDGAKTGRAVVQFKGTDGGMSLVDSAIPTSPLGIEVTVQYILEPQSNHLEIVTTIHNPKEKALSVDAGQFLQFSSRATPFYDDCGQDSECLLKSDAVTWLASGNGDVSYGVTVPKGKSAKLMLSFDKLSILSGGSFNIPAGGDVTSRQFFIVGNGTIEDVRATARAIREEEVGKEVAVAVTLSDELSKMSDAWIRVQKAGQEDGRGWVTATTPGPDGKAVLHLDPGTYDFYLTLPGAVDVVKSGVEVKAEGENGVELTANAAGWLHVTVVDEKDVPVHAALTLQNGADAVWTTGVARYEAILGGERLIPVLPGAYTATVARGLVWSLERKNVTVVAGQTAELTAKIHEAVDTAGYVMMNTHEHTENSIDSSVLVQDRVANALANGIEVMTPTDHDFFGTRQPTIEQMGVQEQIKSSLGCEVSPLWGHTTAAHCATPPEYPTYFAVQYMLYDENGKSIRPTTATEIYTQAREQFGCFFLAVNHPYRGGATFSKYGVTATSNPADAEPGLNLHLVDALEVVNKDDSLDSILTENLPAWFNLLNRGYHIAAIGGSDEHHYRGNYGNPRNMVKSSTDLPGQLNLDDVYQSVKEFHSLVVGGPVVRLLVDGNGMGETVVAAGGEVEVHLVVEAPEWMGLQFAKVVVNGEVVKEFAPVATGAVLRLDETFVVPMTGDGWVVAYAGSALEEHEMVPVAGKQPFSVTNPVFVDGDGNGYKAIHADGAPWDEQ